MATSANGSRIYLVDPKDAQAEPPVVFQFPTGLVTTGITEMQDDVFYTQGVMGDVYTFVFQPNSTSLWEVDMRPYNATGQAVVRKVADMPEAQVPNGLTTLNKDEGIVLMSDSAAGVVWSINVNTGEYQVAIDDPLLKPVPKKFPSFGVNGIHVVDSLLYFANTNQGLVGTVPIGSDGRATQPATVLSANTPNADDFTVDGCGSIWLAENVNNTLVRVSPDGQVQIIAGGLNSTALIGPVAAKFGRAGNEHILYVSTDGLSFNATTGQPLTTNGKIAQLDTKLW